MARRSAVQGWESRDSHIQRVCHPDAAGVCGRMKFEHSVSQPLVFRRGSAVEDASRQVGGSGRQKGDEGCSANDARASSTLRTLHLRVEPKPVSDCAAAGRPIGHTCMLRQFLQPRPKSASSSVHDVSEVRAQLATAPQKRTRYENAQSAGRRGQSGRYREGGRGWIQYGRRINKTGTRTYL